MIIKRKQAVNYLLIVCSVEEMSTIHLNGMKMHLNCNIKWDARFVGVLVMKLTIKGVMEVSIF